MTFINYAFSQQSAFMGFVGVTSELGLPINQIGVVYFKCYEQQVEGGSANTEGDIDGDGEIDIETPIIIDDEIED